MISCFETTLPHKESSKVCDGEEEEELVDCEYSPAPKATHTEVIPYFDDIEDDTATSKYVELVENVGNVTIEIVVTADPTPIVGVVAISNE